MPTRTLNLTEIQQHLAALKPRPVVVHHFATWCGPCADEMPTVEQLAVDLEKEAAFVIISWDLFMGSNPDGEATVQAFLAEADITREVIIYQGKPEDLIAWFEIPEGTVPHTMVYGPEGDVVFRWDDVLDDEAVDLVTRVVRDGPDAVFFSLDVQGATLEQLFSQAATALTNLAYDASDVPQTEKRTLAVEASDAPELLLSFLAQLIHLTQEEAWRFGRFEVKRATETALQVDAWGEQVDDATADLRHHLAEPRPDGLRIEGGPEGWSARIRLSDAYLSEV